MSFSVIHSVRGAQPKSCESQWLRLVPRWIAKPAGLAGAGAGEAGLAAYAELAGKTQPDEEQTDAPADGEETTDTENQTDGQT